MKFIDLFSDEYLYLRGVLLQRTNGLPEKILMEHSTRYQELYKKRDKLYNEHEFIVHLVEGNMPNKEVYTIEDIKALQTYFEYAREMDEYERLEIYKLGYHDNVFWMSMIGIL